MDNNKSFSKYIFDTSPERSLIMSKIRSKNTQPEMILRKALWKSGLRYRLNVKKLPGKPDIVMQKSKIVIFIDGEFWHGYNWEDKKKRIKSNRDYWIQKIEKNMVRDMQNNNALAEMGYTIFRFWEKQIKTDLSSCMDLILSKISTN